MTRVVGLARCTIGSLGEHSVEDEAIDGFVLFSGVYLDFWTSAYQAIDD
jgi:hypothetical protein